MKSITLPPSPGGTTDSDSFFQLIPESLSCREGSTQSSVMPNSTAQNGPSYVLSISDMETDTGEDIFAETVKTDWIIPYDKLVIKETIGQGTTGDFYRAISKSKECAVKVLVNQKLKEADYLTLLSDAAVLRKLSHPNVLPFYGICLDPGHIALVVEYAAKGSLRKVLTDDATPLSWPQRYKIAKEIASGMNYLNQYPDDHVHLNDNLKSNNVLIMKDGEAKITDFGQTSVKDLARTMTSISTVCWTAPEVFQGSTATIKSGVYSYGIILWEIASRKIPYDGEHPLRVVTKILDGFRPTPPPDCPHAFKTLMENCWHNDPDKRLQWQSILAELSHMA